VETSRNVYKLPEESLEERTVRLEMEMEKEYQAYLNSERRLISKESEED
jgi:hypothetical protein